MKLSGFYSLLIICVWVGECTQRYSRSLVSLGFHFLLDSHCLPWTCIVSVSQEWVESSSQPFYCSLTSRVSCQLSGRCAAHSDWNCNRPSKAVGFSHALLTESTTFSWQRHNICPYDCDTNSNVWVFQHHQEKSLWHHLGVLQFNSALTLPGDSVRSHRLRAQFHKTAPIWLQMLITSTGCYPQATNKRFPRPLPWVWSICYSCSKNSGDSSLSLPVYIKGYDDIQMEGMSRVRYVGSGRSFCALTRWATLPVPPRVHQHELSKPHPLGFIAASLHRSDIKSLVISDWTQSPAPLLLRGGAESSNPLITWFVPLASSPHP